MYKRIVVKVGTAVLSKPNGVLNTPVIRDLVQELVALKKKGVEVVLVSSGAVGAGRGILPRPKSTESVADKQVFAAVGQLALMETYTRYFKKGGYHSAQVLVTKEDFRDREHYHNMRRCFANLLQDGIVPIVNENDVIAIKELVFTDNDELAGLVAAQLEADAVILLTSAEGVYDTSPADTSPHLLAELSLTELALLEKRVTAEKTQVGRGGMRTKLRVARKLAQSGIAVHIAGGTRKSVLQDILAHKKVGTYIAPEKKTSGVKRRLAYAEGLSMGALVVNKCAASLLRARENVMSILPVGVVRTTGDFKKGDVVEIRTEQHTRIGFGVAAQDAASVRAALGKKGERPLVHYDYLYIE